jgi:hypothetical protein
MISIVNLRFIGIKLLLVLASSISYSQAVKVPNIFSAGSPAKAAEVNENFNALANAINSITTSTPAQSQAGSGSISCGLGGNYLGLTYTPTNAPPNTVVLGQKLVSVPIIDLVNGARYSIVFPSITYNSQGTNFFEKHVEVIRSNGSVGSQCDSNLTVNGYKAYLSSNDSYVFSGDGTNSNGATGKANASLTIFFGGSQVTISLWIEKNYVKATVYNYGPAAYIRQYAFNDMDYVFNFPWNQVTPLPATLTSQLQALINSVSFKAVQ